MIIQFIEVNVIANLRNSFKWLRKMTKREDQKRYFCLASNIMQLVATLLVWAHKNILW